MADNVIAMSLSHACGSRSIHPPRPSPTRRTLRCNDETFRRISSFAAAAAAAASRNLNKSLFIYPMNVVVVVVVTYLAIVGSNLL